MNFTFNKQDHTYRMENGEIWPSVTQILADLGFYRNAEKYFTEESATLGIYVHEIVNMYLEDTLDECSIDEVLLPYFNAFQKFFADTGFAHPVCELAMVSETYRFAGTVDLVGILNDGDSIIDVKTGLVGPVTGIQLAGYDLLLNSTHTMRRYALQLKNDGNYKLIPFVDRNDRRIFQAALATWHWQRANKIR